MLPLRIVREYLDDTMSYLAICRRYGYNNRWRLQRER